MLTRAQDRPWGACPLVRLQPCMRVDYPIRPLLAALTARRLERPRRPLRRKGQRIARGRPRAAWRRPPRLKLPLAAGMEAAGRATPITAAAARSHPRAAPPRPPPDRPAPPPARGLRGLAFRRGAQDACQCVSHDTSDKSDINHDTDDQLGFISSGRPCQAARPLAAPETTRPQPPPQHHRPLPAAGCATGPPQSAPVA